MIGFGIAAQQLSPGNVELQLLENAFATVFVLPVLILIFGPVSGAQSTPSCPRCDSAPGLRSWRETAMYIPAQIMRMHRRCCSCRPYVRQRTGELEHNAQTDPTPLPRRSLRDSRPGAPHPTAVGAYIGAAHFFTRSNSFANPAITIGRVFSNSFAGIAPSSTPGYIVAQPLGAALGFVLLRWHYPTKRIRIARATDPLAPQAISAAQHER